MRLFAAIFRLAMMLVGWGFVVMLFVGVAQQAVSQGMPKFLLVFSLVAWLGIMTGTGSRRRG